MVFRPYTVGSLLLCVLLREAFAQEDLGLFYLAAVPTTKCDGKAGEGSATFSTTYPLSTSHQQLNIYSDSKNGYAKQKGAVWKIWSGYPGLKFNSIGVPGAGAGYGGSEDPATALQKQLKINPDNHSTTLNISDDSDLFDNQILISVTPCAIKRGNRRLRARAGQPLSSTSAAAKSGAPKGSASAESNSYTVTMTAAWPCRSMPGVPQSLPVHPAPSDVATACISNQITDSADAWKAYGVDEYLSSLVAKETNSPDHPNLPIGGLPGGPYKSSALDIGSTITKDAAGPNICKISENCEKTKCSLIRGDGPVDKDDPARALAFNAYANINNMLHTYWSAIKFANVEEQNNQDQFVKTFFTTTPPSVTWKEILGVVNPFLVILSSFAGLIPVAGPYLGIGVLAVSQINGAASNIDTEEHPAIPSLEEKFDAAADLGTAIQSYVTNMTTIVEDLHKSLIDNVSGPDFFECYTWSWVLKQDSTFVMFVPFGPRFVQHDSSSYKVPYPVVHDYPSFSQQDCENDFQGGDHGDVFTVCDAGTESKGMARIFQITNKVKARTYTSAITGWDSAFEIPGGWKFNLPDVMRGAVNSFEAGGFNYNPDNIATGNLGALVGKYDASPTRPGMWTIPVCSIARVYKPPPNDGLYHETFNSVSYWPDAATGHKDFDLIMTFTDCEFAKQYKNPTTGTSPDTDGIDFEDSGLTPDLYGVLDVRTE